MNRLPEDRHPGGRPSKFTARAVRTILRLAKRGLPLVLCARAVGVSYQGFLNKRRSDERFELALQRAVARGAAVRLRKIEAAAEAGDWRAAAWGLEHCLPEFFAKNRVEVTGADGAPLAGVVSIMLPPKLGNGDEPPVVTAAALLAERTESGNGD